MAGVIPSRNPNSISTGITGTIKIFAIIPSVENIPTFHTIYGSVIMLAASVLDKTSLKNLPNLFFIKKAEILFV